MRPAFRWRKLSLAIRSFFSPRFKILAYHGVVGDNPSLYEVDAGTFETQMNYLIESGFYLCTLESAVESMVRGRINPRTIVLTFDDAHRSFMIYALPILEKYGFPSTVFVPTGLAGKREMFSGPEASRFPVMTWEELEICKIRGVTLGSHSVTHPDLTRLSDADLRREMVSSLKALKSRFGDGHYFFAYPFGLLDDRVREVGRLSGYAGALCFGSVLSNWRKTDLFELKRERVLATTTLKEFRRLVDTSEDFYRISAEFGMPLHVGNAQSDEFR